MTRLICPSCQASLKLTKAMPVSKLIKCPRCGKAIRVPADDEVDEIQEVVETSVAPSSPAKEGRARPGPSRAPVQDRGDEDEDLEGRPQRRKKPFQNCRFGRSTPRFSEGFAPTRGF